jgi:hypothetical protein
MLGSEFAALFKDKGRAAWEAAAFSLAQQNDSIVRWPMVPIALLTPPDKSGISHTATLPVASDYFAIGTPEDYLRLPISASMAQAIANLGGFLLPTPQISKEIQKAAAKQGVQLTPAPQPNRAPLHLMEDYVKHQAMIQRQIPPGHRFGNLVAGHKKDVVVSNIYKPGRVLIYGWFWPDGMTPPMINATQRFGQPIQGRSNIHVDKDHVDYSHGIRFVSPIMTVDGVEKSTEEVLQDPVLSKLVSDEGPLRMIRYPTFNEPVPFRPASKSDYVTVNDVFYRPNTTSLADQGLAVMLENERRKP